MGGGKALQLTARGGDEARIKGCAQAFGRVMVFREGGLKPWLTTVETPNGLRKGEEKRKGKKST